MCAVELELNMIFCDCPALQLILMKLHICNHFCKIKEGNFYMLYKTDSNPLHFTDYNYSLFCILLVQELVILRTSDLRTG